jgi:hypothetical protein
MLARFGDSKVHSICGVIRTVLCRGWWRLLGRGHTVEGVAGVAQNSARSATFEGNASSFPLALTAAAIALGRQREEAMSLYVLVSRQDGLREEVRFHDRPQGSASTCVSAAESRSS